MVCSVGMCLPRHGRSLALVGTVHVGWVNGMGSDTKRHWMESSCGGLIGTGTAYLDVCGLRLDFFGDGIVLVRL